MQMHRLIRQVVFYSLSAIVFYSALESAKFVYLLGSSKALYPISIFGFSLFYCTLLLLVSYSLGQKFLFEATRTNPLFTIKRQSYQTLVMMSLFTGLTVINVIVLSAFSSGKLLSPTLTDLCTLSLQYGVTTFIVTFIALFVVILINNMMVSRGKYS